MTTEDRLQALREAEEEALDAMLAMVNDHASRALGRDCESCASQLAECRSVIENRVRAEYAPLIAAARAVSLNLVDADEARLHDELWAVVHQQQEGTK